MARSIRAVVAAVALTLAGLAGAPAARAVDRPAVGLEALKQAAHTAVEVRLTALNAALQVISASDFMGSDQATVHALLQGDVSGLQTLETKIQGDTTTAEARADAQKIYTDYRVFALAIPVAHMTRAADLVAKQVVPHLTEAAGKLQTAITAKGATSLQPVLDDMKAQTAAAQQLVTPLPAALTALTPADWNADHDVLKPSRTALQTARADLRQAREDARQILAGLR